jgi:hypothetical protein
MPVADDTACPTCGGAAVLWTRSLDRTRECSQGHAWFRCNGCDKLTTWTGSATRSVAGTCGCVASGASFGPSEERCSQCGATRAEHRWTQFYTHAFVPSASRTRRT